MKRLILSIFISLLLCFPAYAAEGTIAEQPALGAEPASDDEFMVWDTSTGVNKKVDYAYMNPIKNVNIYGGLAAAVAAIGVTETTLLISDSQTVAANLSIPATIQLFIIRGGNISVSVGKILTINGTVLAGAYQIFAGTGTVIYNGSGVEYGVWKSGGNNTIIIDDVVVVPLFEEALIADGTYSGTTTVAVMGATLAFGDLVYLATGDQRWELADADAEATAGDVMLGIVLTGGDDGDTGLVLLEGYIRENDWNFTSYGQAMFVSVTAGDMTQTAPVGAADIVRVIGHAHDNADTIFFDPEGGWVEI